MDLGAPRRSRIFDFVSKTYAMVDDPSTDSIISWGPNGKSFIVWKPAECCRLFGITDFGKFVVNGFTKIESGPQLEFARDDDFVRGQPELLENIYERHMEKMKAQDEQYELSLKLQRDRLKKCKNREEKDLVRKEGMERYEMRRRERMDKEFARERDDLLKRIARARETREEGVLSKDVEDRVQRLLALFDDQISS